MLDYCPADNTVQTKNRGRWTGELSNVEDGRFATLIFSLSSLLLFSLLGQANYVMLNCALWSMALLITQFFSALPFALCTRILCHSLSICASLPLFCLSQDTTVFLLSGQLNGAQSFCPNVPKVKCVNGSFLSVLKEWIFKALSLLPSASSSKKAIYLHCHYTQFSVIVKLSLFSLCPL